MAIEIVDLPVYPLKMVMFHIVFCIRLPEGKFTDVARENDKFGDLTTLTILDEFFLFCMKTKI